MVTDWLYSLTGIAYLIVVWHFWRTRWHGQPHSVAWESYLLLLPLTLHFIVLRLTLVSPAGLEMGVGHAISLIAALTVLIYWMASFHMRMEALHVPMAAIGAASVALSWWLPSDRLVVNTHGFMFRLHLLIAMLAYSLFTIAALQASLMSVAEKRLHHIGQGNLLSGLPPLLTLENVLFRLIGVGFALLTLTLLTGVIFSEELFHKPAVMSHKVVFAAVSWIIYALLLSGRRLWGWRGRVAVRWKWIGFVMLLLAYVGSHFVLEVILHRSVGE